MYSPERSLTRLSCDVLLVRPYLMIAPELILDSLDETIILCDTLMRIVYVNRQGEEFFRKNMQEIMGKKVSQIFRRKSVILPLIEKTIDEGRSFKGRSENITIESEMNVDFSVIPFFQESAIKGALISIRRNIQFPEREDEAFESSVQLLASIAHEIKNPLGGIRGAAQLLQKKLSGKEPKEYTDLIIRETGRLDGILQNYLTAGRKPVSNPVNVHEILEKALSILHVPIEKSGIVLERQYDPSLPDVRGDESKLLQAFLNLVKNAVESMRRGGKLVISSRPSSEMLGEKGKSARMALVSFSDTGKGISDDDLKKIFIPFFTKKKKGSGIGLAVTMKIIRDHDGFIKVQSRKKQGTTFFVYLPFENGKKDISH